MTGGSDAYSLSDLSLREVWPSFKGKLNNDGDLAARSCGQTEGTCHQTVIRKGSFKKQTKKCKHVKSISRDNGRFKLQPVINV